MFGQFLISFWYFRVGLFLFRVFAFSYRVSGGVRGHCGHPVPFFVVAKKSEDMLMKQHATGSWLLIGSDDTGS